ncbi:MAG: hypothetical protein FWH27_18375 [Planctomycetaceae bacterium]|nr:hypothetical protein [Planctomycetaceae bacterium]
MSCSANPSRNGNGAVIPLDHSRGSDLKHSALCALLTLFLFIFPVIDSVFPVFVRFVVILAGMTGTVGKTLIPWGYYEYPVEMAH